MRKCTQGGRRISLFLITAPGSHAGTEKGADMGIEMGANTGVEAVVRLGRD